MEKDVRLLSSEITREIWGNLENIILIYLGAAADFAINPSLDWLFFTNQLPMNPQARFIDTLVFNQKLFFSNKEEFDKLIDQISNIHKHVEEKRSETQQAPMKISNEAYMQVLDMIIDYGIRSWEYTHHTKMNNEHRESYFQDMKLVGQCMHIQNIPENYNQFIEQRLHSVTFDLKENEYTKKLYEAYEKNTGKFKFSIVKAFQSLFAHPVVAEKLGLKSNALYTFVYKLYPWIRSDWLFNIVINFLMRKELRSQFKALKRIGSKD